MKVVLQRVKSASVKVDNSLISEINSGYLLLWCIEKGDTPKDIDTLTNKIINLRIFPDEQGKMNKSINDAGGEILLVSQFTCLLYTSPSPRDSRKSRMPSSA